MPRYHVTIVGRDPQAMAELVAKHHVQVLEETARAGGPDGFSVAAIADAAQIRGLAAAGFTVDRHEDVDASAKRHLAEVGKGNRYLPTKAAPRRTRRKGR